MQGLAIVDTREEYDFSSTLLAIDEATFDVAYVAESSARVLNNALAIDSGSRRLFVARERGGVSQPGEFEVYDLDGASGPFTFVDVLPYPPDTQRSNGLAVDAPRRQEDGPPGPSGLACPPGTRGLCEHELPACANGRDDDGLDNDGGGKIDWDGGPRREPRDPQCIGTPWKDKEAAPACGFGAEVALVLPVLAGLRRRSRTTRA